jgi:hypothetical protein
MVPLSGQGSYPLYTSYSTIENRARPLNRFILVPVLRLVLPPRAYSSQGKEKMQHQHCEDTGHYMTIKSAGPPPPRKN